MLRTQAPHNRRRQLRGRGDNP